MKIEVFLAVPTHGFDCADWKREAEGLAQEMKVSLSAPTYAHADGILALLPPNCLSLGVPIAIGYAYGRYMPMAIVYNAVSRHLPETDAVRVFPQRDMEAAIRWLKESM